MAAIKPFSALQNYVEKTIFNQSNCGIVMRLSNRTDDIEVELFSSLDNLVIVSPRPTEDDGNILGTVANLARRSMHCVIGFTALSQEDEKMQRRFKYSRKSKTLSAPSHQTLGELQLKSSLKLKL